MGLAGPRKRCKIGHDPNNTTWSRSNAGYGQKILLAQGWIPGDYLGAKDAPQSAHFSDANASHIRVLLRDDNLGLGAQRDQAAWENFGLTSLQDLYGRLNGKSKAELQTEERHRADVKRKLYADRKWGSLGFVSGGVLVGTHETIRPEPPQKSQKLVTPPFNVAVVGSRVEGRLKGEEAAVEAGTVAEPAVGQNAGEVNSRGTAQEQDEASEQMARKAKKKKRIRRNEGAATIPVGSMEISESSARDSTLKAQSRSGRKARRRQRRLDQSTPADEDPSQQELKVSSKSRGRSGSATPIMVSQRTTADSEEGQSGRIEDGVVAANQRTTTAPGSRLAVRQRFIKQKRMSSMDPQALKEILMLKS